MSEPAIVSLLKRQREEAGLSQLALAERVGVSRQALIAIEAGRAVPSTSLSLQLARALGCSVDDLFKLAPADGMDVSLARSSPGSVRVVIGQVEGRWVAHPLPHGAPAAADGILLQGSWSGSTGVAQPLVDAACLAHNVLVAGCAPLLGTLAQRVGLRYRDARVTWLPANSGRALDLLAAGLV
ncbi:MAG TPA: helix-turn-helix transcriptional regulator, partial [Myxococcaceae bacterium]|nr:helix-turn-helix transcriptional regulator [Myxococcaceae bacterium]